MNKKTVMIALAFIVSICMIVALCSAIRICVYAVSMDQEIPTGSVMLAVVTVVCAVVIWRDVIRLNKDK